MKSSGRILIYDHSTNPFNLLLEGPYLNLKEKQVPPPAIGFDVLPYVYAIQLDCPSQLDIGTSTS